MDGEPPQEEDFSQIPIAERSQHKNWKARLSAYTDVIAKSAKTASDTDPFFRPYVSDGPLLKKWCLDANVVAQEKGVEAVLAIVQYSGETSARTRSDVVPALVEKGLGSTRAGTKRKAGDLCAMYVEVENTGDGVMTDVLVGLDSKQPKAVAGAVLTLKELVESFGIPALGNVKPILKSLSKIFAHTDKTVRAEGTALAITLHSYLGEALLPSLSDLKPVQMAELQKAFDTIPGGSAKPTRFTRKVQRERENTGPEGAEEVAAEAEPVALDPRSFLDPVNVLKSFPPDLMDLLASSKWKERLEALEACNAVLADPQNGRISDSNIDAYGPLASTLGTKCKSDMNVNVVMEAAKLLEGLCKGVGKPFGRYRSVTMPGQLERLKERKANVVEALAKSLDAMFACTGLQDIIDDVLAALKSKNPQVKEGTLKFLHRSLCTTTDAPGKDQIKPIAESLVALLGDSVEPVRTSAAECLGSMMKILGERLFNPFLEGVGDLQMAKVKDAFEKAEIRYRAGGAKSAPGPAPKAAPPVKKVAPRPNPSGSTSGPSSPPIRPAKTMASPAVKSSAKFESDELLTEFAPPAKAPPARFGGAKVAPPKSSAPSSASTSPTRPTPVARKQPPATAGPSKPSVSSSKPAAAGPSKAGPSKTLAVSPSEPVKYRFTPEDAAAQADQLIPADYHTKLADPAWKVRLEAAEEMITWVSEGGAQSVDSEVMLRFLGKTPGWGEKNFQVSAKVYEVMRFMAEKSPTFGRPAAALAIGPLTDKLGDIKLKKPSGDALTAFAGKTSLAFVLSQSYEPMTKQKAPKAQADALGWIKQQLVDFGIAGIPLREMIGFLKVGLGSPNAAVRSSATQALVTVKIFVGADISGFLEDLNPQLLSTINSEFDKVAGQTPPEPTRQQADLREAAAGPGKASKGGADPLDDLIPRVDLDKLVASTSLIADSKSDAWKVRKEAFEALAGLLEVKSNSRLKPNMGEVGGVLKKAMADTNLAVKMLALSIISKIAVGMGQPFDKHLRLLTAPVCSVCADQKATTRTAAVNTLSAMADAVGALDHMYAGLATSLENLNPALRSSVLGWLAERLQADAPSAHADLAPLAVPILSCLEDRNGDVRKAAGAILPFVVASAGFDYVMDQTSSLKPASKATIVPLINNARGAATGAGPSKPSVPAPSASSAGPSATPRAKLPSARVAATSSPAARLKSPAPATRPVGVAGRSLAMKALSSAPVTRPPSSLSSGDDRPIGLPKARVLPRPATSYTHHAPAPVASSSRVTPFSSANPDARPLRLKRDATRWVLDPSPHPKTDLSEYLAQQMELNVSPETYAQLFSKDHRAEEDFMAALTSIAEFYSDQAANTFELDEAEITARQIANVDLALKYAGMRLLGNNSQLISRCLEVISRVVETMTRLNERLGDAEVKLFVPALVFKLGDAKFVPKLQPIFDALGTVTATSQILGLLVQYGLDDKSAGKTCKNEAMQLIEKAYKRRGSILRIKDERGFYETVAKCISDSGTRQAALSLMALLQSQGTSPALQQVVDGMPAAAKDMLANRRATMAASKPAGPSTGLPIVAKVSAIAAEGSPSRLHRPTGTASPGLSRLPKTSVVRAESPEPRSLPIASGSKPRSAIPSPAPKKTAMSALPRTAPQSQQTPSDAFAPSKPALQPLRKSSGPTAPLPLPPQLPPLLPTNGHAPPQNDVLIAIDAIRQDDVDSSVDALKTLQDHLLNNSEAFRSCTSTLVDTLCDELDRVFNPPTNLLNLTKFRLVKHLLQATNNLSANQDLMRRLKYADIYTLIYCLSLRLVQADRLGGAPKELAGFMNQIMIQIMSMAERDLVFKVMFRLLVDLSGDFSQTRPEHDSEVVAHADLVLKCLWKRCRVIDDDLRHGRVQPGTMLNILEDFTQAVNPMEYRKREAEGVALGELPLRTIKTIMQRIIIYAKETDQEVFDILRAEFGDRAADTIVYSYIFRLLGKDEAAAAQSRHRNRSPLLPVANSGNTETSPPQDYLSAGFARRGISPVTPVEEPVSEAEALIKGLGSHNQKSQLDKVHAYITANPDKEVEVQKAISAHLSDAVQIYVRRALEQRKAAASPPAARETVSPNRSPGRPVTMPATKPAPRRSLAAGPRPSSVAVDKSAPIDDQLSAYKALFNRGLGTSQSGSAGGSPGEPLREIDQPQGLDTSID